jgi:hypothetical protein
VIANKPVCPMCRQSIAMDKLLDLPTLEQHITEQAQMNKDKQACKDGIVKMRSTKIDALIQCLKATPCGIKSVVFSQWTSMLDLVGDVIILCNLYSCLNRLNHVYRKKVFISLESMAKCLVLDVMKLFNNLVWMAKICLKDHVNVRKWTQMRRQ